jgi:hypothetical protein
MGEAIGDSLSMAIGIALSPVPIIAVVLMLTTDRDRVNGPAHLPETRQDTQSWRVGAPPVAGEARRFHPIGMET